MDGAAGAVAMYVVNGSHVIDAPVVLNDNLNVTVVPANNTLTVSNLQDSSVSITKNGAGALRSSPSCFILAVNAERSP